MGIHAWQLRNQETLYHVLYLEQASQRLYLVVPKAQCHQAATAALWQSITQAVSKWHVSTLLLDADMLIKQCDRAPVFLLAESEPRDLAAIALQCMPSLESMVQSPKHKAKLWHAIQQSFAQAG